MSSMSLSQISEEEYVPAPWGDRPMDPHEIIVHRLTIEGGDIPSDACPWIPTQKHGPHVWWADKDREYFCRGRN